MADKTQKDEEKENKSAANSENENTEYRLHTNPEVDQFPLPNSYNLDYMSYYVHQNEWVPTKPLRPIAAMSASPGPAIVCLPSTIGPEGHDPTKTRAPSYKMCFRHKMKDSRIGPGPGAYDINEVRKVTNMGPVYSFHPTIGTAKRFKDKTKARRPGPACYSREDGDKHIYSSAPSYSIPRAIRGKHGKGATVPGPNAYTLPHAFGYGSPAYSVGPAYSIGKAKRMPGTKSQQNPGPGAYMLPNPNVTLNRMPAFYIGQKTKGHAIDRSPGPGLYAHHLVKLDKYSTPRITFGIRHSPYKALPGFDAVK